MYLEINNLVKSYDSNSTIIKNLSLTVDKGEFISFIGESGSGKSTFLKCLSGLEKINSGSIKLNGRVINNENIFIKPQNRNIGFVFQDYPLFPHLNLYDNITFNLNKEFYEKINYIIDLTNLKNLLKRYPYELSGGEQQRACIARALVREPDLLLLDEPFSNLDKSIKKTIKDEIYNIISETKTTSILVTHDIKDTFDQVTGLNTDSGKMFRLYNAAFSRFPDADGLKYWIKNFSSGIDDERAVSSSFLASAEFKQRYGDNITHETYVRNLYLNVLNRELDQGGYDYWVGNLNNGIEERHEVLLGFSESAENKTFFTEMTGLV